ncbi:MAG: ABC-F family ATP-binding cassette domain-containing protein, partial [Vicinamibacteria bacterium]
SKRYGARVLWEDVNWHVRKNDRIGLCGPNGAGKSTLLKILAGLEEYDSGQVRMATDLTIGYLPQDGIAHKGRTLHAEVSLAFAPLLALKSEQDTIEATLEHEDPGTTEEEHMALLDRYAEVMDLYKNAGGFEMDIRIASVLRGLGFKPAENTRLCEEFSGGWQMRIALAKLLLARPNLLLMDEPTNHLDLPACNWLEEYLHDYEGSVVLVSHDRFFLDAVVKRITQVELRGLTDYWGNYSKYVVDYQANLENLLEAHRRQSEDIEKTEAFINRFRYQATKARQVQSRIKQLDKVERIEIPAQRAKIHFHFPEAPKAGRVVLDVKNLRRAYGNNVILDNVNLTIERGDRIALVGPNGAGKSTLMRVLAGDDKPTSGEMTLGHQVVMDYFAQNQADILVGSQTVFEEMSGVSSLSMAPMIRSILGGFLFSGDDVYKKVTVLSGGERNRLALAKMLLKASNLLLLDEPTNHLDLDSKDILLEALAAYTGTIIFVSHDRHFVDRLAMKVIDVGDGQAAMYPGGYEDFLDWKKRVESGEVNVPASTPKPKAPSLTEVKTAVVKAVVTTPGLPQKPPSAPLAEKVSVAPVAAAAPANPLAPRLRKPDPTLGDPKAAAEAERQARIANDRAEKKRKQRLDEVEKRIAEKEAAVAVIEKEMTEPGFFEDRARSEKAAKDREGLMWEVNDLMAQWELMQQETVSAT